MNIQTNIQTITTKDGRIDGITFGGEARVKSDGEEIRVHATYRENTGTSTVATTDGPVKFGSFQKFELARIEEEF